ncbi:MAG: T9SS type A sorting domain-containing protein [Arcicella sp.]|nr:T9SS type A sorting domain-containing protein [Arcicella sp.]
MPKLHTNNIGEPEIKVIPSILNSAVADLKATNCANSEVSVAYGIDGNPEKDNVYTVQLSDETGENFKNIVATGTISPLKIMLPKDLKSSNPYKVRVLASNPALVGKSSTDSLNIKALAVGTVTSKDISIYDYSSVPVTFTLTGEAPWTIQKSDNQTITASTSPQTLLLKPTETTTFSSTSVKGNLCGKGFARGSAAATVLAPLSAEEEAGTTFNVFSNPAETNVTVSLKTPSIKITELELIDLQGKILLKINLRAGQNQEIVNMENLSAGTYLIHLMQDGKDNVRKVIKIK